MAALPPLSQIAGPHYTTYEGLYRQADPSGGGTVAALDAANFLKLSGLKEVVLSQIWDICEKSNKGYLDKEGVFASLKLIALAQNGLEVSLNNILAQVPPPNMGTPGSPAIVPPPSADGVPWAITQEEKLKYDLIFEGLQPVNDLLSGDQVRPVLMNSKLHVDVLSRVWELSDVDADGFLDRPEFAVAMHLVYKALEKEPVPVKLPLNLVPPTKRRRKGSVLAGAVPVLPLLPGVGAGSGRSSPSAAVGITASPVRKTSLPNVGLTSWVITPADQDQYNDMFKRADLDMDGFVNGVEIKDVFLQSGVSQQVLAHIWNLCDTRGLGKLNSEQFALAMYFIKNKLLGIDPPQQLTPEMMPPSMRTLGSGEAAGPVTALGLVEHSGLKELDMISKDIDELKREKMLLEQDKAQTEADIKIRNGEVAGLQKELDAINSTLKQLENQKAEAQKRLDDLDDKRCKLEGTGQELKEKCEEEQKTIESLQSQIGNEESWAKNQEEELNTVRDQLGGVRQEELLLEQKVETGRNQLDQLTQSLTDTQAQIKQAKSRLQQLKDNQSSITQGMQQYSALLNGETTVEPDSSTLSNITPTSGMEDFSSARATIGSSPVSISSISAFSSASGFDDNKEDPFKGKDPFSGSNGEASDPFQNEDPFKNTGADDPFKGSDPFKSEGFGADPFGGSDPFTDALDGGSKKSSTQDAFGSSAKADPFKDGDPFGGAFGTKRSTTAKNDPFDPFGDGKGVADIKSPENKSDPFGVDPFAPQGKSPTPALPPKQKKPPPRPPAPKKGGISPKISRVNANPAPDPFAGEDPFGESTKKKKVPTATLR